MPHIRFLKCINTSREFLMWQGGDRLTTPTSREQPHTEKHREFSELPDYEFPERWDEKTALCTLP